MSDIITLTARLEELIIGLVDESEGSLDRKDYEYLCKMICKLLLSLESDLEKLADVIDNNTMKIH